MDYDERNVATRQKLSEKTQLSDFGIHRKKSGLSFPVTYNYERKNDLFEKQTFQLTPL